MNARDALIEAHAGLVQEEIRSKAQTAHDQISVRVGWMIRSDGQRRRYEKAKRENVKLNRQEKTQ